MPFSPQQNNAAMHSRWADGILFRSDRATLSKENMEVIAYLSRNGIVRGLVDVSLIAISLQ